MSSLLKRIIQAIRYILDGSVELENQTDVTTTKANKRNNRNHKKEVHRRNKPDSGNRVRLHPLSKTQRAIDKDPNLQERIKSWNRYHEAKVGSEQEFIEVSLDDVKAQLVAWHPIKLTLFVLARNDSNQLEFASISIEDLIPRTRLVADLNEIDKASLGELHKMVCHVHEPLLLFIFEKGMYIWNYNQQKVVANIDTRDKQVINGGFYPDNSKVWSLVQKNKKENDNPEIMSYEWQMWDYKNETISQHQFQLPEGYKQNAILHPSGLVILNVIRDYRGWGFLYYKDSSSDDLLYSYNKPTAWNDFSDIEQPVFSPSGRHIALISRNLHLTTGTQFPEILIYDFETAKLKSQITLRVNSQQSDLQFGHSDKTIAFIQDDLPYLHIYSMKTQTRIALLKTKTSHTKSQLTAHRLYGYYAVVDERGLYVLVDENDEYSSSIDLANLSKETADQFMKLNADNLRDS